MNRNFSDFGPYADSNRVAVWGRGETSDMFYVLPEKGEYPNAVGNVAPVLIYDRQISKIQKEVRELKARLEELAGENIPEIIELRNISFEQAKKEIKELFETNHGENLDAGHIMSSLCIDYDFIDRALIELEKEGKIVEAKLND